MTAPILNPHGINGGDAIAWAQGFRNQPYPFISDRWRKAYKDGEKARLNTPIPMILYCPACGLQHIDAPDPEPVTHAGYEVVEVSPRWTNPPHRSHLCQAPGCGHVWRPADVCTTGVAAIRTKGKADSPSVTCAAAAAAAAAIEEGLPPL